MLFSPIMILMKELIEQANDSLIIYPTLNAILNIPGTKATLATLTFRIFVIIQLCRNRILGWCLSIFFKLG